MNETATRFPAPRGQDEEDNTSWPTFQDFGQSSSFDMEDDDEEEEEEENTFMSHPSSIQKLLATAEFETDLASLPYIYSHRKMNAFRDDDWGESDDEDDDEDDDGLGLEMGNLALFEAELASELATFAPGTVDKPGEEERIHSNVGSCSVDISGSGAYHGTLPLHFEFLNERRDYSIIHHFVKEEKSDETTPKLVSPWSVGDIVPKISPSTNIISLSPTSSSVSSVGPIINGWSDDVSDEASTANTNSTWSLEPSLSSKSNLTTARSCNKTLEQYFARGEIKSKLLDRHRHQEDMATRLRRPALVVEPFYDNHLDQQGLSSIMLRRSTLPSLLSDEEDESCSCSASTDDDQDGSSTTEDEYSEKSTHSVFLNKYDESSRERKIVFQILGEPIHDDNKESCPVFFFGSNHHHHDHYDYLSTASTEEEGPFEYSYSSGSLVTFEDPILFPLLQDSVTEDCDDDDNMDDEYYLHWAIPGEWDVSVVQQANNEIEMIANLTGYKGVYVIQDKSDEIEIVPSTFLPLFSSDFQQQRQQQLLSRKNGPRSILDISTTTTTTASSKVSDEQEEDEGPWDFLERAIISPPCGVYLSTTRSDAGINTQHFGMDDIIPYNETQDLGTSINTHHVH